MDDKSYDAIRGRFKTELQIGSNTTELDTKIKSFLKEKYRKNRFY